MPASTIPDIGIGKRLRFAHMAFSRALRLELGKEGVSFGQFVHLERLWEEDGLTQTELSARVGVETASSTSILDELERMGLVQRTRDPKDRRKLNVSLTPAGRGLRRRLTRCAKAVNDVAKGGLTEQELRIALAALERMQANLGATFPAGGRADSKTRLGG